MIVKPVCTWRVPAPALQDLHISHTHKVLQIIHLLYIMMVKIIDVNNGVCLFWFYR